MGMSASQARLITLTSRMSDIEYQGQQINQQRTTLAQQANTLYNSLLTLDVPTPPSTQDYTTVKYTGTEGASTFTLGQITPSGTTYSVDLNYTKVGHYMAETGTVSARRATGEIKLETLGVSDIRTAQSSYSISGISQGIPLTPPITIGDTIMQYVGLAESITAGGPYYVKSGTKLIEVTTADLGTNSKYSGKEVFTKIVYNGNPSSYDPTLDGNHDKAYNLGYAPALQTGGGYTESELNGYYVVENGSQNAYHASEHLEKFTQLDDGTYVLANTPTATLAVASMSNQAGTYNNVDSDNWVGLVAESPCYTLNTAVQNGYVTDDQISAYLESIRDAFPDYADATNDKIMQDFSVYFTTDPDTRKSIINFVMTQDVATAFSDVNNTHYITSYNYQANGKYTEVENKKDCLLTFDSSGRITEIKIPVKDNNGNITSYKTFKLEAKEETDSNAYQDAYARYEYDKYQYDVKQEEINAKTRIIQQEDKNLELKLTRLDNERNAVNTEIDAVKKVVQDNIEKSYKTFSG